MKQSSVWRLGRTLACGTIFALNFQVRVEPTITCLLGQGDGVMKRCRTAVRFGQ